MKALSPRDENDKRRLILKLVTQLRCVECGRPYVPHDFVLMERQHDVWVLGIRCRHCGSSGHVIVATSLERESESVTDLTPEERKAVHERPLINVDDVLDVHQFLEDFDGDFRALFDS
jgi:DNA-directed RNA polymerase subunit RPC12/RpoP